MIYTLTLNPALDLELTVESFSFNQVLRATYSRTDCGGKGFNVSRALAAVEQTSTALGFIGGTTGQRLEVSLHQLGIDTDFVYLSDETRTNISIVTTPTSDYIKVNQSGPTVKNEQVEALLGKVSQISQPGDYWVLSGSVSTGVPNDIYAQIIRSVQSSGARAVLDTSGEPLRLGCNAKPYLVKPNGLEAQQLTGIEIEDIPTARMAAEEIRSLGISMVVLSLAEQGALLSHLEGTILAKAPVVQEQNPIGAGDALVAGLVWGLQQGFNVVEILRWGVAFGAAAASLPGTGVGGYENVARLTGQVMITPL
jgi:1-phosphofructokinase family hexose kinase